MYLYLNQIHLLQIYVYIQGMKLDFLRELKSGTVYFRQRGNQHAWLEKLFKTP